MDWSDYTVLSAVDKLIQIAEYSPNEHADNALEMWSEQVAADFYAEWDISDEPETEDDK
jgi:hypothetical protein